MGFDYVGRLERNFESTRKRLMKNVPEQEEGRDGVRQIGGRKSEGKEECPLF